MTVENWLSRVSPVTQRDYRYTFARFMKWKEENGGKFANMTPDEMITYQKACDNGNCYELLDVAQKYILSLKDLTYKSKRLYYVTILSFFLHNRAELPKDKSFIIRGDKPKTPSVLRPHHIQKAVLNATPVYASMITCMLAGSMGISEILEWSNNGWENLRDQLNEEADVIRIDLPGRKKFRNETPYFTLIGGDALRHLKFYLNGAVTGDRPAIFLNRYGGPITHFALRKYWIQLLFRVEIITKKVGGKRGTRYGCGLHELRDNFRTLWSQSGANSDIGEFLMGHAIDPYEYNQCFRDYAFVVQEYRKAIPFLNVVSGGFDPKANMEMENLRAQIEDLKEELSADVNQGEIAKLREHSAKVDKELSDMKQMIAGLLKIKEKES